MPKNDSEASPIDSNVDLPFEQSFTVLPVAKIFDRYLEKCSWQRGAR